MASINVGIVGLGWVASGHLPVFQANPHTEVTAQCLMEGRDSSINFEEAFKTHQVMFAIEKPGRRPPGADAGDGPITSPNERLPRLLDKAGSLRQSGTWWAS